MSEESLDKVREILSKHELSYRNSARRWKTSYRAMLGSSALFSASAAVVGKLAWFKDTTDASDWAAILAGIATVITTLIAALDFEANWRTNRRSRHEVGVIALESEKTTADADTLLTALQEVVRRRNDDLNKQD